MTKNNHICKVCEKVRRENSDDAMDKLTTDIEDIIHDN